MNKKQATALLIKSRLLSKRRDKSIIISSSGGGSGCVSCGKKKSEHNLNRMFGKNTRRKG